MSNFLTLGRLAAVVGRSSGLSRRALVGVRDFRLLSTEAVSGKLNEATSVDAVAETETVIRAVSDGDVVKNSNVRISTVEAPHAINLTIEAGKVDKHNYDKACDFLDKVADKIFKTQNQKGTSSRRGKLLGRSPGALSVAPLSHHSTAFDDRAKRYTVNRSPFVHKLSQESFAFLSKRAYTRRGTYQAVFDPQAMKKTAHMLDKLVRQPLQYLHPTLSVTLSVEADAYFAYQNEAFRQTVKVGPWGNNILEKRTPSSHAKAQRALHETNPAASNVSGSFSAAEDAALRELREVGSSWEEREALAKGTLLEGRSGRSMKLRYQRLMKKDGHNNGLDGTGGSAAGNV